VKLQTWWCCLTKTGEVGVFRCLGVVVALPMKEGGEGCARRGRESTEGGGGGRRRAMLHPFYGLAVVR
jgi:hypothetical protein